MKDHLKQYWSLYLSGIILAALVLSYFVNENFRQFFDTGWDILWSNDEERITSWFKSFGIWGPLMIIMVMTLQMFLIIFPTWLPMIVAVLGYGSFWGVVISLAAVFVASTLGYYLGATLAAPMKKNVVGEKTFEKLSDFMTRYGFGGIVLFRISPFLSNDAISFVAGIIKMGYIKYLLATFTGIFPLALAIAYFGKNTETLEKGLYGIGGFGVLIYAGYLIIHFRHKRKNA